MNDTLQNTDSLIQVVYNVIPDTVVFIAANEGNSNSGLQGALFAVAGIFLAAFLAYIFGWRQYKRQKQFEQKRTVYSKLYSLRYSLKQAAGNHGAEQLWLEYFKKLYEISERDEIKIAMEEMYTKVNSASSIFIGKKEQLFELLGLTLSYFSIDEKLKELIEENLKIPQIKINPIPNNIKTHEQLDECRLQEEKNILEKLKPYFDEKIKRLIIELEKQL